MSTWMILRSTMPRYIASGTERELRSDLVAGSQIVPLASQWCREATTDSARYQGAPLLERCSQIGVLALLGCGRQTIWCAADESEYPGGVVDANLSLRPLKVQPRLRGTNEPLGLSITHHPATPLPLPTRTGAYLAAQVHEQRVPGKSNSRHCSLSAIGTRIVPPRGIAVQGQNLGRR